MASPHGLALGSAVTATAAGLGLGLGLGHSDHDPDPDEQDGHDEYGHEETVVRSLDLNGLMMSDDSQVIY